MLVVEENPVASARFPVIDMHTHVSSVLRREPTPEHPLQGSGEERLGQIVAMHANKREEVSELWAGDIADALPTGLDGLGAAEQAALEAKIAAKMARAGA